MPGGIGLMQRLDENWSARYEVAIERHIADWRVTDEVRGVTGSYDDYAVSGAAAWAELSIPVASAAAGRIGLQTNPA